MQPLRAAVAWWDLEATSAERNAEINRHFHVDSQKIQPDHCAEAGRSVEAKEAAEHRATLPVLLWPANRYEPSYHVHAQLEL